MKKILFILILLIGFFLRFYQLGEVPAGLTNDEASLGYDTYSLLKTGRDQWNVFLPLNFKELGDYRLPAYIYLSLLPVKVFGLSEFSIRFISAFFGFLSIVFIYFLSKKLFNNEKIALASSFLIAISPWSIGLSRVGLEAMLGLSFFVLALLLFFYRQFKSYFIYLSVLFFSLTLYTYSGYTLFTPLVIFLLLFFYRKYFSENKVRLIILLASFIFLIAPLFVGNKVTAGVRFSQVGIINNVNSIGVKNILDEKRGACQKEYPMIVCRTTQNKPIAFLNEFFGNYISHFSFSFLYLSGNPTQYSILPQRGLEFLMESVFLALGIIWALTKKKKEYLFLLSALLLAPIPDALTGGGHYSRSSLMLPFLLLFEGAGLFTVFLVVSKIKIKFAKYGIAALTLFLISFTVLSFFITYLTYYRDFYSLYSHYGHKSVMKDAFSEKDDYDRIYISKRHYDTKQYIFFLFFNKYDPLIYQSKKDVSYKIDQDGWISIDRIENIYFVDNLPFLELKSKLKKNKILLIANPADLPKKVVSKAEIKDKLGNIIFKEVELQEALKL